MLTTLKVNDFKAVPYLETSLLMRRHKGRLQFSTDKPNVIVGPNGAGKSALMESLALRFLAQLTGDSRLDGNYLGRSRDAEILWTKTHEWRDTWEFLQGLTVETDNAPALYYRPGHIPGNETSPTHALMCGYSEDARHYDELTKAKSAGQQSRALQEHLLAALDGTACPKEYALRGWTHGREPRELHGRGWIGPWEYQAEVLKAIFAHSTGGTPLVLMDEPEQSLDALAEMQLWKALSNADCTRVQVVVATHSLYPLLHPDKFNIIEAVNDYARDVIKLLD